MISKPHSWKAAVRAAGAVLIGATHEEAAEVAGVTSRTITNWRASSFWDQATEEARSHLLFDIEAYALRTVLKLTREGDGKAAMWALERLRPQDFRPSSNVDHTSGGKPIAVATPESRAAAFQRALEAKASSTE